jgi:glycosyltransferase involved in cell wall biosynthesis
MSISSEADPQKPQSRKHNYMNRKTISVIMPALNEELSLVPSVANVLECFRNLGIDGELIIVNDGSSDSTGLIAEELASRHDAVRVLHHATSKGIGEVFRNALSHSCGEFVVYIPGDGEIDAAEILRYMPLLAKVDMVVPYVINPEIRSRLRRLISTGYHVVMTMTFSISLKYLNGTVIYRTSILEGITLRNTGFFYQAELLIKAIRLNYSYEEVPYVQRKRINGSSKSVTKSALMQVIKGYIVMVQELSFSSDERSGFLPLTVSSKTHETGIAGKRYDA